VANWAALIAPLSISGSRLSDGTANASGKVWVFQPGTSTPVNVYSDAAATAIVTQPITLTNGGLLNRSDLPGGLFATQPIRLYIEDVTGTVVSDAVYIPATAGDVGVNNAGFTDSTLDAVLTKAFTSFGGQDWKYKESSGASSRTVAAKFAEIWVSVKDFGAVGDGVAIDTTAIQNAINRVKALGGGVVYFPPGTYLVDQALTLSSANGVHFVGSGAAATTIRSSHATANLFTLATCNSVTFEDFTITHAATSTGSMFSLTSVSGASLVRIVAAQAATGYRFGLTAATCAYISLYDCRIGTITGDAAGLCFAFTDTSLTTVVGGSYNSGGTYGASFGGSTGRFSAFGAELVDSMRFIAGLTGSLFTFVGCLMTIPTVDTTDDHQIKFFNSNVDGDSVDVTSGGTVTPNRMLGPELRIRGTTTGAAYIIAAPVPVPNARDTVYTLHFFNNTGGAVTGWTMNAAYHLTGAISTVNGEHTELTLRWDEDSSVWRETARAVTT
jgi:hypothetical protein